MTFRLMSKMNLVSYGLYICCCCSERISSEWVWGFEMALILAQADLELKIILCGLLSSVIAGVTHYSLLKIDYFLSLCYILYCVYIMYTIIYKVHTHIYSETLM